MDSSIASSHNATAQGKAATCDSARAVNPDAVLVCEAGVPFQKPLGNVDPLVEWIDLMEAVQMLCPDTPARFQPTVGKEWKL